jgi:hypothetical protein
VEPLFLHRALEDAATATADHPRDHGQNISAGTESRSSSSSAGAGTATDLPDEGHGLAVPDGRELPHLARAEELQRAQLAQRPPVGPVGSEGEVMATVADDLRGEQVHRKAGSDVAIGGAERELGLHLFPN